MREYCENFGIIACAYIEAYILVINADQWFRVHILSHPMTPFHLIVLNLLFFGNLAEIFKHTFLHFGTSAFWAVSRN